MDCFNQWEEENDSNSSELDDSFLDQNYEPDLGRNRDFEDTFSDTSDNEISDDESFDEESCKEEVKNDNETKITSTNKDTEPYKAIFSWTKNLQNYVPRMSLPSETEPIILAAVTGNTSELDTFLTLFPTELFEHIANCTNQRLEILRSKKVNRANV